MSGIFGVSGTAGQTQTDALIEAFRSTQQPKINSLNSRKTDLERRRSFFNTLNTRINSMLSEMDKFTADNAVDNFFSKKIISSNSDVLTATANKDASLGIANVKVNKLAQSDILISKRLNLENQFGKSGTINFTISSGDVSKELSIELNGEETNQEAMRKIVDAINNETDLKVNASFVKDTSSTGRISLTSSETGEENRIIFDGDSKLNALGINKSQVNNGESGNRLQQVGAAAGYRVSDSSELNSNITFNGIEITRASNTIDDLVDGLTLNLLKAQEEDELSVNLTTEIDSDKVKGFIDGVFTKFNDLLKQVSNRDIRRSDPAIGSLQQRLRALVSNEVSGLEQGAPKYFAEIGVEVASDGTVKIGDSEKLNNLLKEDPNKVADLFLSEDGFIAKIQNAIANLEGEDGLIKARTSSLQTQIKQVEDRTASVQSTIDSQADSLRQQYNSYLKVLFEAQSQFNLLQTMPSGSSGAYDSLLG